MRKHATFDEMFNDNEFVTPEEREQINFEVDLIGKMIDAREAKGLSQRESISMKLNDIVQRKTNGNMVL